MTDLFSRSLRKLPEIVLDCHFQNCGVISNEIWNLIFLYNTKLPLEIWVSCLKSFFVKSVHVGFNYLIGMLKFLIDLS